MDRQEWLDQVQEEILEPELAICDPHHHLWDHPQNRYLLDELRADIESGHNVVSTVFMECGAMYSNDYPIPHQPVGETEFVAGVAAMSASGLLGDTRACVSIVGYADLTLGSAVRDVLEHHREKSQRFVGIRHAAGWDASEEVRNSHTNPIRHLYLDQTFRQGFQELVDLNMTFDAWLYHEQIPEITELARAFPDATIVLDHFGGPLGIGPYAGKRQEIFEQWRKDIATLAQCENVHAKIGGLVMPINGFGFHKRERPATSDELVEATRDYYMHTIEHFGVNRCMFESNFPVDRASCSYAVLWNSFKKIASGFSPAEKAALFHDTAMRVYEPAVRPMT